MRQITPETTFYVTPKGYRCGTEHARETRERGQKRARRVRAWFWPIVRYFFHGNYTQGFPLKVM